MPDPAGLTSKAELVAWLKERDRLAEVVKANPLAYFEPNAGGQREFLECEDPKIQGMYLFAANKTGKTTAAVIKAIERACGRALWGGPARAGLKWRAPNVGALFCEDFDTHRTDLLPRFFTWCPRSELAADPIEAANGEPARILFKNGSVVYLRTYQQGYEKHEGKDYDWVLCNEPVGRDIYTAIWRGFTATNGVMFIAATLLSQVWLYDEMQHPFIKVFDAAIYDNPWLSRQAVENFAASLSEEEKQVRLYGRPTNLSGMVYPNFRDKFPFVVKEEWDHPVEGGGTRSDCFPWDVLRAKPYPIVMCVDPHERKPLYVEWAYITPLNEVIWFDWDLVPSGNLEAVFERIAEKERSHHHAAALCIMDPNRGKAIQKDGSCWQQDFEAHDYPVLLAEDDTRLGHAAVGEMLAGQRPRMRWTQSCMGTGGPVWQMQRYVWDDWQKGGFKERDQKERPKDINKDFPDLHRYMAMALRRLTYSMLLADNDGVLNVNGGNRGRNPYLQRDSPASIRDYNEWTSGYRRN